MDDYVEVQLQPASTARKAARAETARGFDPGLALRGISSQAGEESACQTRGDGKFEGGANLKQVGRVVHVGPEAFKPENARQTIQGIDRLSGGAAASNSRPERVTPGHGAEKGIARGGARRDESGHNFREQNLVRDINRIIAQSERAGSAGDATDRELYDLSGDGSFLQGTTMFPPRQVPEHSARFAPSKDKPEKMEVSVRMPLVDAISQVSIDIVSSSLSVSSDVYALKVAIPFPPNAEHTRARWKKEAKVLKVTLRS